MKTYVPVWVMFDEDGRMLPRALVWRDGLTYGIDRVKDIRRAAARKAGGMGDRYTIMVRGQERYLFFEHSAEYCDKNPGRWFLEEGETYDAQHH